MWNDMITSVDHKWIALLGCNVDQLGLVGPSFNNYLHQCVTIYFVHKP